MKHDQLHRVLEDTTNQAWDPVAFSEAHLKMLTVYQKTDVLVLIDETRLAKTYVLKKPKSNMFDAHLKSKLAIFAEKVNIKNLIPTIQIDLNYFHPINGTFPINENVILNYSIKPNGTLTLQSVSSINNMIYNLTGTLGCKAQANTVLNDFISDLTIFTPEIDFNLKTVKFNMKRDLKLGPAHITFTLTNLNTFQGSLSLSLKHQEIIYKGWKFTGDLFLNINGSLTFNEKKKHERFKLESVVSTEHVITPKINNSAIILMGGVFLVGVGMSCVISGGICLAVLGLGGSTLAISS